ncbi:hypothetical protein A3F08_01125 [Candidatus Berkelbacteria bacterium RIFCSPHIGHO2_12_FULL_36_9]|uniref:Uncharacterized protein n=1 Tax=Candidatus Berkelbacteria bacterium RIFCSPHIGHO2_12_FULL_36_9 TaxID=1797469 RepID=A0A1F5EDV3_9BACT|nr:MAG: hypothetical protein A3F08_01125 [Candidatus Berkelbacteria bacterium RIFCSPHIGHO2_12_FULL_36_9]
MKRSILCLLLVIIVVINLSVETSYRLELQGFDPSGRNTETIAELSSGAVVRLDDGERQVIEGNISAVIHQRAETGWHVYELQPKCHQRIVFGKSRAKKAESFFSLACLNFVARKRTKILLFSPELLERTYPGRPPIYYLSSILKRKGFDVLTVDVDIVGRKKLIELLKESKPDIIGGTSLSIQINEAMELMKLAKMICPEALTILGGNHATAAGEYLYPIHSQYLDMAVIGEGLTTITAVAEAIESQKWEEQRGEIPGLMQWDGSKIVKNVSAGAENPNSFIPDLPYNPLYNFLIFNKDDGQPRRTCQIMTAFGCKNACFFCFNSTNLRGECNRVKRRMNLGTIDNFLRDASKLGYEAVYFDDDTFTRDGNYALEIAKMCMKHGLIFGCHTRPDCENEEIIRALAENGCRYMFSGLESTVPEILLAANKTKDPIGYREAYLHSFHLKNKYKIPVSAFMIHGMPRLVNDGIIRWYEPDRIEDSRQSIEFAVYELDPTYLSMNVLRFLPGTPFAFANSFEFMRPVDGLLHGGYFDRKWLEENGKSDPRSLHPILRAFEGSGSPIPVHMTPRRCYEILTIAVKTINSKNAKYGANQTILVVDPWFEHKYLKKKITGNIVSYELAPFEAIS